MGALAEAIKEYGGGVIMISHSSEFTSALCPEKWIVADGKLTIEGQTEAQKEQAKLEWKRQEEMTDAFGNTIKVKAPKKVCLTSSMCKLFKVKYIPFSISGLHGKVSRWEIRSFSQIVQYLIILRNLIRDLSEGYTELSNKVEEILQLLATARGCCT